MEGGRQTKEKSIDGAFNAWKRSWLRATEKLYKTQGQINLGPTQARTTMTVLRPTGGKIIGRVRSGGRVRRVVMADIKIIGGKEPAVRV